MKSIAVGGSRGIGRAVRSLPPAALRLWAAPVSLLAVPVLTLAALSRARFRLRDGVLEAEGGVIPLILRTLGPRRRIEAITLGHVVLARDGECQERHRDHERVHVRQTERWGALFPIAYLAASVEAWARGGDAYRDNRFEREARGEAKAGAGAYTRSP